MKQNLYIPLLLFVGSMMNFNCQPEPSTLFSTYKYIPPLYDNIWLATTTDTVNFALDENTYNAIISCNTFSQNGDEYISFYDERSASVNIYHFQSKSLEKKILIKNCLKRKKLYKTTVYCKSFDSIFITNKKKLYLLDSAGIIHKTIDFLENPNFSYATLENTTPLVFKNNLLYTGVRPYVNSESLTEIKKWKVIYSFDLQNDKARLDYHLPELYRRNFYGYHFLDYSYCFNNDGNFVFSFAADSNIYETNLTDYHIAYFAKSRFQARAIRPANKKTAADKNESFKNYITQDSYGPIYFDPFHKRYLRVVKSGITKEDYEAKNRKRNYRFIIFNDQFQIIGECPIQEGISYNTLVFTDNGNIYARTAITDEYKIHFVRLIYNTNRDGKIHLTKK